MLRLIDIRESKTVSVEVDEYIPFVAEFESDILSPPLYWRGGDGKRSLVEIGLERQSGIIKSITLTAINPSKVKQTEQKLISGVPEVAGCPIFDISTWSNKEEGDYSSSFMDEMSLLFSLTIGRNYLSVNFEKTDKIVRFIRNAAIRFGITERGELTSIDLLNLTDQEIGIVISNQINRARLD